MIGRWRAHITADRPGDYQRDLARLYLVEDRGDRSRYLLSNGEFAWVEGELPHDPPEGLEFGLAIPSAAIEELVGAIDRFQGKATHGPTEVAVLREALEVERGRVERMLDLVDRAAERKAEVVFVRPDSAGPVERVPPAEA